MMKITKDGIIHKIKCDRIFCNWIHDDFSLFPVCYDLTMEIRCPIDLKPTIKGLDIERWLNDILSERLISTPDNNTVEFIEFCQKISRKDVLFVNKLDNHYILNTLFQIMSQLLDEDCELLNIEYDQTRTY